MKKVLIAYVTKTGTTANAAEIIGGTLREEGFDTTVLPISGAGSLDSYDSVIIGAPINGMAWHPDATAYVANHAAELAQKDVSYYLMSYIYFTGCNFWKKAISKAFDKLPQTIHPRMTGLFGGKVDKEFPAFARFLFGVRKGTPTDVQDGEAVRHWAKKWADGA
ncbi:MAG: flavodoxin domain-containing protein [Saccharofermentanales bacterium]